MLYLQKYIITMLSNLLILRGIFQIHIQIK